MTRLEPPARRRPKNRRAQIAETSAAAFGALGYHGVSMEVIARRLGISSTALYRHYPSKYALFREELLRLAQLTADTAAHDGGSSPTERLDRVLGSLITATIENRATVALVRWEERYLADDDRRAMRASFGRAITVLSRLIGDLAPESDEPSRVVRAVCVLSVISSIGDHRATLPDNGLAEVLRSVCWSLVTAESAPVPVAVPPQIPSRAALRHEILSSRAIELFERRGYPNVGIDEIVAAAGMSSVSAFYRYYESKRDLLTIAIRRAAERVADAIAPAIAESAGPAEALRRLVGLYVAGSFADRDLTFVYYAEFGQVAEPDRRALREIQWLVVDEWARLVEDARPQLDHAQARIVVHATFGLVVDLGRSFGADAAGCSPGLVAALMTTVLLGAD